jgi:hypothetical protein
LLSFPSRARRGCGRKTGGWKRKLDAAKVELRKTFGRSPY